jgi:gamma-glutamyl-gamma-aminobutyrate hydrolase PuuD
VRSLTVVIVGHCGSTSELFKNKGHRIAPLTALAPDTVKNLDAVIFTGGADICPYLYGQELHPKTQPDYRRDMFEIGIHRRIPLSVPKIGICRGGQLLNVLSGGSMWQHVNNHCGEHDAIDLVTNKTVKVTSIHHQEMRPSSDAIIMAKASMATEKYSPHIEMKDVPKDSDIEACYYPHTKSYCIQGHPEYPGGDSGREMFWQHLEFVFAEVWRNRSAA